MSGAIRILQADADSVFRQDVSRYFESLEDFVYIEGLEAADRILDSIAEHQPNIVLLDLDLPPQGGFPVLGEIRKRWSNDTLPIIMLARSHKAEAHLTQAVALGASYFILRPVDLVVLENRVRQLLNTTPLVIDNGLSLKQVQEICVRYFDAMGIPPHYKGYRYLIEGIWLASLHPTWLSSMTKKLYPAIGQRFGTSGSQVERAMRYALDMTWEKGVLEELYRLFPYEVRENKGKPTNSAFIAKMADLVALEAG
jgi:two-component system response regulator (stage 0 sporulation protein A)